MNILTSNSSPIEKTSIDEIKERLENLYNTNPNISIDIMQKRKRMKGVKAILTGVYTNFITVESMVNRYKESFTISYIDIMIGNYKINELSSN